MIKKKIALLTAVVMVLLSGCSKPEANPVTPQGPAVVPQGSTDKIDHSRVCDKWADKGSFKMYTSDKDYFDLYFDYRVPQIIDDTEDAKEINYFIECLFEDMHNTMQKAAKDGKVTEEESYNTEWFQTNYDCYWNGSIASIVIYSTGYFDTPTRYNVYNYDFEAGTQLSNEDLFALKGITSNQFVDGMRRAAVYSLDKDMQQFFEYEFPLNKGELWYEDVVDESVQHMYADYLKTRAQSIHYENINEYIPVYLDENGELQAVAHLYNMGMFGEVDQILSPKKWVNNDTKAFCGDLLDVISKDDGMYLIIYRDDWSEYMHDAYPSFDYAKEYKINGLYKNYIDAKVSWVGNGMQPYILLLSDDGMISYVDVWAGIVSEYFSAVEPLWGLQNIKAFSDSSEGGIMAVNNDGELIDIDEALYMMLNCKYVDFEKNMLNLGNITRYSATVNHNESGKNVEYEELIGFTDDQYHMFVRESYRKEDYRGGVQTGYIVFNGMNEKGMVYYFSLVGEQGELGGTMAINAYSFWDSEYSEFIDQAEVTWLSGFDIFESNGHSVMLTSSVG